MANPKEGADSGTEARPPSAGQASASPSTPAEARVSDTQAASVQPPRSEVAQTAIALGGALFLVIAAASFAFAVWMLFAQVTKDIKESSLAPPPSPALSPTPSQEVHPTPSSFTQYDRPVFQQIAAADAPSPDTIDADAKAFRDYQFREQLFRRFSGYVPPVLAFVIGLTSAIVGYALLRAAGSAPREIIPPQDYELLSEALLTNNTIAINDYIRLGSLTGAIGAFTKLGITGLPLATIGLTILFALLGLAIGGQNTFFDLAKLTLGAFIGSYVQRQGSDTARPTPPPAR